MTTSVKNYSSRVERQKESLTALLNKELNQVQIAGIQYGTFNTGQAFSNPAVVPNKERLITRSAEKELSRGQLPDLRHVCRDLFNALFAKGSSFTALEFLDVLKKRIRIDQYELTRFLNNPTTNHVLVDDPLMKVVLIHWRPGQTSSKHLHPGGGGVYKVLRGSLEEKRYHRLDETRLISHSIHHQESTTYIDDNMGYHVVSNPFETSAISLHAYVKGQQKVFSDN